LDGARDLAGSPAEVELALWFHDAVYRTYRKDNETRSAEWAARFLTGHGAAPGVVSNVRDYVMATAHAFTQLTGDAALVVDIDLSILGQQSAVYARFEQNVRREYWWVSKRRFTAARCAILRSFLERPFIYHGPRFRERYEAMARANLASAIRTLEAA
jgi:predicted metal-dependent HD superfamily phosphohydrolase